MMTKAELFERLKQTEWTDFEIKEALDKLPKNVWESVCSFSNTRGGWIVFGVKERRKQSGVFYEIQGVNNVEKLETDFTNTLRGGQKFNQRIASQPQRFDVDGKIVVAFYIPMSECKPVYIGTPTETYIRLGSSDQHATQFEVNALLRDQSFGKKSNEVVIGSTFVDINQSSFQDYRNYVKLYNPSLKYNILNDEDFCIKTGIIVNGMLTIGGLLMFGKLEKILEFNHDFIIDYIEIPGANIKEAHTRYTYRMQEQENIWDYFKAISYRLRTRLDNPFSPLLNGFAPDDESQMYCVREALVNFLAHADYFSEIHSTIRVYDNSIELQNPGSFPVDLKIVGLSLVSQPRNPNILRFFKLAKLSENGGYGIDKINEWKQLTGSKVIIKSSITYSEVRFLMPINANQRQSTPSGVENSTYNSVESKILALIGNDNKISLKELANKIDVPGRTLDRIITSMKAKGIIKRVGSARSGHWEIIVK
ncbi:MAG: putative DNA binding domain-containing protein [Muribaculaceae bacterium]|nr:putative DNA binding domain-containing protein [Muribaculaceae bacterium]